MKINRIFLLLFTILILIVTGCSGNSGSGQMSTSGNAMGAMTVRLVDSPTSAFREINLDIQQVQIHASATADRVVLGVRDSGPGFPPAALERAFEPFFTTRQGGLGLGLSLCESLAAGMGGALVARNAAEGGAELSLTLPSAATPAAGAA